MQSEQTSNTAPRYKGIRGASSAARLSKLQGLKKPRVVLPGGGQQAQAQIQEQPQGQADRQNADEEAQVLIPSLTEDSGKGLAVSPPAQDTQDAAQGSTQDGQPGGAQPVANIFAAAQQLQAEGGPQSSLPAQAQETAPKPAVSLEQARAQAFAQHLPTRRPINMPAAPAGQGLGPMANPAATSSNLRGFFSFLLSLVHKNRDEQKPDRSLASMLGDLVRGKRQQGIGSRSTTMQGQGLFSALDAPLQGLTPDDIQYAGDVDAALSRRPKVGARFISAATIIFFAILLVWAAFSKIDEVTHSEGSVVGSQSTQTISNLEGGILRAMLVRDGSTVQKGDVIAQIDNEMAASSYRDAMQRSMDNVFALIRLEAELKGEEPVFPQDLYAWATDYFGTRPDASIMQQAQQIVRDQKILWKSRKERFLVDREVLNNQLIQRDREIQEQTTHREQLQQSLSLAKQQRDAAEQLVRRNNFSKLEFLNMESRVVELQGQIDMLASSISRAQAAAAEARHRIESHEAEFRNTITEEINKRRVELTTLQETLAAGGDRVTRTDVRSPVRGIVKQIYINTIGGVIKPGEPILDIVPLDDTLLVEARVRPQDVAFLRPGQDVMVKVTAYDFSIYGGLEGKLEQISADTIEGKQGEFYYLAKIRTSKTYLEHNNEILPIIPGMIVQADILTGKKTILQYLLKPILKAKQNALTER